MKSFCLSPQTSRSESSSSPCSMIYSEDGKDDFVVEVSDFNVPFNFHAELTKLDMASSAIEWLEGLELPYQTTQDPIIANSTISTPSRTHCDMLAYKNKDRDVVISAAVAFPSPSLVVKDQSVYTPEVFQGSSQSLAIETSCRERTISQDYHGSQIRSNNVTSFRAPEVLSHYTPQEWKETNSPGEELKGGKCTAPHDYHGSQIHPNNVTSFRTPEVLSHYALAQERKEAKSPDEELKRGRPSVPDEFKDERYWRKRSRNNISAKKSREAKRARDILIAHKIDQLEKENAMLKMMLANVMMQQQQQQQNHHFQWQY